MRERAGARLVSCGPLVCVHFTGEGTSDLASLHGDFDAQEEVRARYGEISQLVVFDVRKMGRVGAASRKVAGGRLARWGPSLRRSGLVLLGDGLAASMMRVAIRMSVELSRTASASSIFDGLAPALAWVQAAQGQHELVRLATLAPLSHQFGVPLR